MNIWLTIALGFLDIVAALMLYGFFRMKSVGKTAASENIIHLTDKNFMNVTRSGITIVDFWAEWCAPCRMLVPVMNELADENKENFKVGKLNVDESNSIAARYGIRSIPTVIIFRDGKESKRFVGVKPKNVYLNHIRTL